MILPKHVNAQSLSKEELWDIYNSGKLSETSLTKFIHKRKALLIVFLAFVLGYSASTFHWNFDKWIASSATAVVAEVPEEDTLPALTKVVLFEEIQKQGIICPDEVLAQAEIESAYLKSGHSKKTNNLFGMRYPAVRKTTAIGLYLQGKDTIIYGTREELKPYLHKATYAVYAHWTDAVTDYKHWQDFSFKTRTKYLEFLQRVYATAPNYAEKIREISRN